MANTSKERLLRALRREPVDAIPAAAVTTGITVEMMRKCGIFWPEAHRDPIKMAGLAESIHLYTELEAIKLPFCMTVESEAMGATIDYRTMETVPSETGHIFDHPDQMHIPADFLDRGRIPVVLKAISTLRARYDQETPIISSIVGPFSLATKLFGFQNFLVWFIDHPDWVHQVMAALTPLTHRYIQAEIEAGADAITIGEAGSSGDLLSGASYGEFIAPYHRQLCSDLSVPTILHICGKSTRHAPFIAETGVTAYSFDEGLNVPKAREALAGKVSLVGYVPTVSVLLNGTPADVFAATTACLEEGVDVLTPGCALPPHTPLENIAALVEATRHWNLRQQPANAAAQG